MSTSETHLNTKNECLHCGYSRIYSTWS